MNLRGTVINDLLLSQKRVSLKGKSWVEQRDIIDLNRRLEIMCMTAHIIDIKPQITKAVQDNYISKTPSEIVYGLFPDTPDDFTGCCFLDMGWGEIEDEDIKRHDLDYEFFTHELQALTYIQVEREIKLIESHTLEMDLQ